MAEVISYIIGIYNIILTSIHTHMYRSHN